MVYDESRNYIGDMHWRKDEILQDGDEFELDRSILIQVGEALGSLEQDLTGLFEKRKKAPEVAVNEDLPHQPIAIPMARPTALQLSQLRPKTLNALLGTPKGRIGRAFLPTKSPHDLRMEIENRSFGQDRPAKRQRIESQVERIAELNKMPPPRAPAKFRVPDAVMNKTVVGAVSDNTADKALVPPPMQSSRPSSAGLAINRPPVPPIQRGENQKDEVSKRVVELLPQTRPGKARSSDSTAQQRKRRPDQDAESQDSEGSRKAQKSAKRPEPEPEKGYARTSTVPEPIGPVFEEDATSTNKQPRRRTKLLLASRKPRKTLTYQDPVLDRDSRDQSTSKRPDRCKRNPMTEFHEKEQARLKARLNRHQANETHREDEREQHCGDAPGDLFISQEDPDDLPAENYRTDENEPGEIASTSCMTDSRRRNTEPAPSSSHGPSSQEASQHIISRAPSTVHSTAIALAKMDEILISRSQPKHVDSVADKIQPQEQEVEKPTSKTPVDDSHLSSPPETPQKTISSPSFQNEDPPPARTLQTIPAPDPARSPPPNPATAAAISPPTTNVKTTTSLTAFSRVVAPKPPEPPPPETPTTAPHPPKRKPDSLPAFTKVVPSKPRSPLKKSVSDTSAMRPPSALPASGAKERTLRDSPEVGTEESASLWSKEAWDLFGCGRDGVQCTYEEFKRKEGLA